MKTQTKILISDFFYTIAKGESRLEYLKQNLNNLNDFDPFILFNRLDQNRKNFLNETNFINFIQLNFPEIIIPNLQGKYIILFYDTTNKLNINYNEFLNFILNKNYYNNNNNNNKISKNKNFDKENNENKYMSYETEKIFTEILYEEFNLIKKLDRILSYIKSNGDFSLNELIKLISINGKVVDIDKLNNFLNNNNLNLNFNEINLLIFKLDLKKRGKIDYKDLDKIFNFPFISRNNNNKNKNIFLNNQKIINNIRRFYKQNNSNNLNSNINQKNNNIKINQSFSNNNIKNNFNNKLTRNKNNNYLLNNTIYSNNNQSFKYSPIHTYVPNSISSTTLTSNKSFNNNFNNNNNLSNKNLHTIQVSKNLFLLKSPKRKPSHFKKIIKINNLSYNNNNIFTKSHFFNFLKLLMNYELEIENFKYEISFNLDYNIEDLYQIFESKNNFNNNFLTYTDLYNGFKKIGFNNINNNIMNLFINRFNVDDINKKGISYSDFFDIYVTFDTVKRNEIENRNNNGLNKNTLQKFIKLNELIFKAERLIENERIKLNNLIGFNIYKCFINENNFLNNNASDDDLEMYFIRNKIIFNHNAADLLFIRLDKNRDGKIGIIDFINETKI